MRNLFIVLLFVFTLSFAFAEEEHCQDTPEAAQAEQEAQEQQEETNDRIPAAGDYYGDAMWER